MNPKDGLEGTRCKHCGHSLRAHLNGFCIARPHGTQCGCENYEEAQKGKRGARAGQTILEEALK